MIKIWVDDERERPKEYDFDANTVDIACSLIYLCYTLGEEDIFISLDHDAGKYVKAGGVFIQTLIVLEKKNQKNKL